MKPKIARFSHLAAIFAIVICAACAKKQHDSAFSTKNFHLTNENKMLLDTSWKEVKIEVYEHNTDDSKVKNITGQFMKSDLDDVIIFNRDGTYIFDEGNSKARKESLQVYQNGNWQMQEDQLLLSASEEQVTQYQVLTLTPEKLVLKYRAYKKKYFYILTYHSTKSS